jgi:hypothetical protein
MLCIEDWWPLAGGVDCMAYGSAINQSSMQSISPPGGGPKTDGPHFLIMRHANLALLSLKNIIHKNNLFYILLDIK